jgi:ankyrin repeat protein
MRSRRVTLVTLVLLAGIVSIPIVLTWREVRQERLNHALIAAVDRNDVGAVRKWLCDGADPNAQALPEDKRPWWQRLVDLAQRRALPTALSTETALVKAIDWLPPADAGGDAWEEQNASIVTALLDAGADLNRKVMLIRSNWDRSSRRLIASPIVEAAQNAKWSVVHELMAHHADINAADGYGNTALMFAAHLQKPEMVKSLIQQGADVNLTDDEGETALFWLFDCDEPRRHDHITSFSHLFPTQDLRGCATLLLQAGASVHTKSRYGATLMSLAQDWGDKQLIQRLKQAGAK